MHLLGASSDWVSILIFFGIVGYQLISQILPALKKRSYSKPAPAAKRPLPQQGPDPSPNEQEWSDLLEALGLPPDPKESTGWSGELPPPLPARPIIEEIEIPSSRNLASEIENEEKEPLVMKLGHPAFEHTTLKRRNSFADEIQVSLHDKRAARRAFLLQEILGPCRALAENRGSCGV